MKNAATWAFLAALLPALLDTPGIAVAISEGNKCVAAKNKAAARALVCLAKRQNRRLLGGPADLAPCGTGLRHAFTRADDHGGCPTTGDAAGVEQRVEEAETGILAALDGNQAIVDAARECVARKNMAAAKLASCTAKAVGRRLRIPTPPDDSGMDFAACASTLGSTFTKAEQRGGCPTIGDAVAVARLARPAGTNLAYAMLASADLTNATLNDADLRGADLSRAKLSGADLSGADLSGAILYAARLNDATVSDANLTDANLTRANLTRADLSGATLSGATLAGLSATSLAGCPASLPADWGCVQSHLLGPGADLAGAHLAGMDLSGRNLTDVDLMGADLTSVALNGANLTRGIVSFAAVIGANLSGATLTGADLTFSDFSGASLTSVTWGATRCPDARLSTTNGSDPESCCAYLSGHVPAACSP